MSITSSLDPLPTDHLAAPPAEPRPGRCGTARAALLLGGAAVLTCWVPLLGFLLGQVGAALAIVSVTKPGRQRPAIIGLALASLGMVVNVVVTSVVAAALIAAGSQLAGARSALDTENGASAAPGAGSVGGSTVTQGVETPCFSFNGPASYINNQSAEDAAECLTSLQLWGERDEQGQIQNTGFGSVLGSVEVNSILVESSDEAAPDRTIDSIVDALNVEHIPTLGTVSSLKESVTLDGMPANITRVISSVETTKTKVMITSYAPEPYQTDAGPVQLFLIYLVIPEDNGEEILATVLDSWRWH
ncbi:hypothetical protein D6T64_04830 [Cryobacterium melibiosiphilum]|uniref:DUF4190 domain-containing protein n=1 Tax=Cryobacterium melibiosiphilum TaxID=995039 RepID=A0A3A5MSL1_9MICO|nr:hypothetical protein [Cryobacterium melibiosiphilum]RJT90123.1 hypothetical protein D6T64_04830 [Cryobacterium melibiosiphilum]